MVKNKIRRSEVCIQLWINQTLQTAAARARLLPKGGANVINVNQTSSGLVQSTKDASLRGKDIHRQQRSDRLSSVLRFSRNPEIIMPALAPIVYISALASGAGLTNVGKGRTAQDQCWVLNKRIFGYVSETIRASA